MDTATAAASTASTAAGSTNTPADRLNTSSIRLILWLRTMTAGGRKTGLAFPTFRTASANHRLPPRLSLRTPTVRLRQARPHLWSRQPRAVEAPRAAPHLQGGPLVSGRNHERLRARLSR